MPGDGVLIVGYGNPLRADDDAGWQAAERLAADERVAGARVLARHQLTPELAADVHKAGLVVLVDAAASAEPAGTIAVRAVQPGAGSVPAWSHHLDPAALVALAELLYGSAPPVYLVSVVGASLEVGEGLSDAARRAMPAVADAVVRVVAERGHA